MEDEDETKAEEEEETEVRMPKILRDPGEPTKAERDEHEKLHLPYRSWCPDCVAGRAREDPHRRANKTNAQGENEVPVVQIDFGFFATPIENSKGLRRMDAPYVLNFARCQHLLTKKVRTISQH